MGSLEGSDSHPVIETFKKRNMPDVMKNGRLTCMPCKMATNSRTYSSSSSCIPKTDCNCNVKDNTANTAVELSHFVIKYVALDAKAIPPNRHAETLQRTVDEVILRHKLVFNNIAIKLKITRDTLEETFIHVVDEMVQGSNVHWGRIVTIYAFGGVLAKHCVRSGMTDMLDRLARIQSQYIIDHLGSWIDQQGGWDAFDDHFPAQGQVEKSIWKGLFFTAIGLGALASMVAAR